MKKQFNHNKITRLELAGVITVSTFVAICLLAIVRDLTINGANML